MNLLGPLFERYIQRYVRWLERGSADPAGVQQRILERIVRRAEATWFGRTHGFASIKSHADFAKAVPIADFAARADVYERIFQGEPDVCWPGRTRMFALTSGTTAGEKHIPVSPEMKRSQINAGMAIMAQISRAEPGLLRFIFGGKLYFLGGGPIQPAPGGARLGAISNLATDWVPWLVMRHYEPGRRIQAIDDFEVKCREAARRFIHQDIRLCGHLPSWSKAVFDSVCAAAGVPAEGGLSRVWPNFAVQVHGGMNFEPFRPVLRRYFRPDHRIRYLEVYMASEGFIAAQPGFDGGGMEMLVDNGIFFEFVPLDAWGKADAPRLRVHEVEVGTPYCVVLSTSAGLWAYDLGDIVRFTSLRPPRVLFAGRHQLFMNAFGEHVIGEEIAQAVAAACQATGARIEAFTTAPVYPTAERPAAAHQYVIEFIAEPAGGLDPFVAEIERTLSALNLNYEMKRKQDKLMTRAEVTPVPRGTFYAWMKQRGKLGDQNKVPLCANDRRFADSVLALAAAPSAARG